MSVIWPRPTWRPGWTGASGLLPEQEQCSTSAGRPRKPAAAVCCGRGGTSACWVRGGEEQERRRALCLNHRSPTSILFPPPPHPSSISLFSTLLHWSLFKLISVSCCPPPLRFPASWLTEDNFQYHNQLETGVNIDQKLYRRATCERAHTCDT